MLDFFLKFISSSPLNLKVEGDTVTFSFEMRSGREHNTPDKAMWGFACTVRAQVLTLTLCGRANSPVCLLTEVISALEKGQSMSHSFTCLFINK